MGTSALPYGRHRTRPPICLEPGKACSVSCTQVRSSRSWSRSARAVDLVDPAPRAVFEARIDEVRRDEVPYAVLTSGIVFDLPDRDVVLARWHETIEALAAHDPTRAVGPV